MELYKIFIEGGLAALSVDSEIASNISKELSKRYDGSWVEKIDIGENTPISEVFSEKPDENLKKKLRNLARCRAAYALKDVDKSMLLENTMVEVQDLLAIFDISEKDFDPEEELE